MRHNAVSSGATASRQRRTVGARRPRATDTPSPSDRRTNLLVVSWIVTCACAYLAFADPQSATVELLALLVVGGMMAGNVIIGRLDPQRVVSPIFSIGIAVFYSGLLLAAWQLGGQGSVELLVGALALLDLALVGLSAGELAAVSLAMFLVYAVIL